jgi:hypothetical protein
MTGWYILSTLTFLPLVGALFIWVIRGDDDVARRNIRAHRAGRDGDQLPAVAARLVKLRPRHSRASSLKTRYPGLAG